MKTTWACPRCKRRFTRENQRHACGTGDRASVLRNRPPELVQLYAAFEAFAKTLGPIEFVTRERYVLLRTTRIFTDLVVMSDCLRVAIHLPRRAAHPLFVKVASDRRHVTHVAKLRGPSDLAAVQPFIREAYAHSAVGAPESSRGASSPARRSSRRSPAGRRSGSPRVRTGRSCT